jgi:hypothetical protein
LKAKNAAAILKATIPSGRRRTALMYARGACTQANGPSDLSAIYQRMVASGYRTRTSDPLSYLRRVLARHSDFNEVGSQQWVLLPPRWRFDPDAAVSNAHAV